MAVFVADVARTNLVSKPVAGLPNAKGTVRDFSAYQLQWQADQLEGHITTMNRKYLPASVGAPVNAYDDTGHAIVDDTVVLEMTLTVGWGGDPNTAYGYDSRTGPNGAPYGALTPTVINGDTVQLLTGNVAANNFFFGNTGAGHDFGMDLTKNVTLTFDGEVSVVLAPSGNGNYWTAVGTDIGDYLATRIGEDVAVEVVGVAA